MGTNIHICYSDISYSCPHCMIKKHDKDDKLLNRCNKNKSFYTKIKCDCGKRFGFTYNIRGDATTFKLNDNRKINSIYISK